MGHSTNITWTDATFNPWIGCTRISPACDHCYAAESTPTRHLQVKWGVGETRYRTKRANWMHPLRWNNQPYFECACGRRGITGDFKSHADCKLKPARRRVFCASLADVFDNEVDPRWRSDLLALIAETPNLDWLLLTKRIGNVRQLLQDLYDSEPNVTRWRFIRDWLHGHPPANVWLGATICNQAEADRDVPKLLQAPAATRFLSIEPMLGPVDLRRVMTNTGIGFDALTGGDVSDRHWPALDWVIVGGESGKHARPMDLAWGASLRDACSETGVAYFFKQVGSTTPDKGGCLLDEVEHKNWPRAA